MVPADLVRHGTMLTVDDTQPTAEAVAALEMQATYPAGRQAHW